MFEISSQKQNFCATGLIHFIAVVCLICVICLFTLADEGPHRKIRVLRNLFKHACLCAR
jgi:hypothetical protein